MIAAALMFGMAANADVNFVREGEVLKSGETYTYSEYFDLGTFHMYDPDIYLLSDEDCTVDVTAECTTGQKIGLCCGGQCVNGVTVTKENIALEAGKQLPANFDYNDNLDDDSIEFVSTELSVKKVGTLGVASKITVVFDIKGTSVTMIENDADFYYSAGNLNYNVADATELALFDAKGNCALRTIVRGAGSIATSNLSQGIYVYTLGDKSGKIFVK